MKKYRVALTANTSVFVTLEAGNPDDPYDDENPFYAIQDALDQLDRVGHLVASLIEQLRSGNSTVDFTVDEWEEITQ